MRIKVGNVAVVFFVLSGALLRQADAAPLTIVALGDSTTAPRAVGTANSGRPVGPSSFGWNESDPANPPHNQVVPTDGTSGLLYVYADVLRDRLPLRGVKVAAVDNEGIGGNRADEGLARFASDVVAKSPSVVIIQFGLNDAWWDSGQPADLSQPDSSGARLALDFAAQTGGDGILGNGNDHPFASRGNYTDILAQMVDTLEADGASVILMTPNPSTYGGSLAWWNDLVGQYAQAVRNVADSRDTHLVDVFSLFESYDALPGQSINDLMLGDALHPNGLGHELIADTLADILVREIAVPEPGGALLAIIGGLACAAFGFGRRRCPTRGAWPGATKARNRHYFLTLPDGGASGEARPCVSPRCLESGMS